MILCIIMNKNINFNKNETESKMENPTHSFRETNLVLQLIYEFQIKNKTDELELAKEKQDIFYIVYFVRRNFFLTFVFYLKVHCIEYTFRIYILLHIHKHYFIHFFVFKIFESLKCILKGFAIFTGKHLCWSLFLVKLRSCNFIEKRL